MLALVQSKHQIESKIEDSNMREASSLICVYLPWMLPTKEGSFMLPPASPRPATGRLYVKPANWFCMVSDNTGPST